ncbi:MAG: UDP-N-acetylmuramoyl-L-alanine--D-glutamate ligase, partial [bacterium]
HPPYDNSRALVLGAGVSGVAAAQLLRQRGGSVVLLDEAPAERLTTAAAELSALDVELRAGRRELPDTPFDLCVTSPGFALSHPWLEACRARRIPVIAETELGFVYWPGRVLAITGSKGKSSLVKLCADTLTRAGVPAAPAGNYGTPLSRLATESRGQPWAVVEVSSFQVEHLKTFRPDVAILLNLQADHLDRHDGMAEYRALKLRLFENQSAGDVALLPEGLDDGGAIPPAATRLAFGTGANCNWRYFSHAVTGRAAAGRHVRKINISGSWFDNPVLGLAAAAGAGALAACGLEDAAIARGLAAFEPLPHRMQRVAECGGVCYVDDSKATSLSAVAAALGMVSGPVRLIAGGRLKEHDLDSLKELLTSRVRKVYLIGECAGRMVSVWSGAVSCKDCGTLDVAVAEAAREARAGETVLLSPGCASFDQFGSYRERGERFTRLVREIVAS